MNRSQYHALQLEDFLHEVTILSFLHEIICLTERTNTQQTMPEAVRCRYVIDYGIIYHLTQEFKYRNLNIFSTSSLGPG